MNYRQTAEKGFDDKVCQGPVRSGLDGWSFSYIIIQAETCWTFEKATCLFTAVAVSRREEVVVFCV